MSMKQKIKQMIAAGMLAATLSMAPAMAQEEKKPASFVELQKATQKQSSFTLTPAYSIPGQYETVRICGGGQVAGIGIGGFLDLYGTKDAPTDMSSHCGKVTASKSLDGIVKGSGVAVEFTTISGVKDRVRAGIYQKGQVAGIGYKVQFYPIAPKGKGPSAGVFLSKKITQKLDASAFVTSDLGAKSYYGEAQFSYGLAKDFSLVLQERYGGNFGEPFRPQTHIGIELKL
jgi:hypothetical protein